MLAAPNARKNMRNFGSRVFGRLQARRYVDLNLRAAGSGCYRFSSTARLHIFALLLMVDLIAIAAGMEVLALRTAVTATAVGVAALAWAALAVISTLTGGRNIQISKDLFVLARIDSGLCAAALALAAVLTRVAPEHATGETMLLSLSASGIILVLGRVAVIVQAGRWRTRWIQHVVLIGTAQAVSRQLLNRPFEGAHVAYAGAILVGEGTLTLPVLARIDARNGGTFAAGTLGADTQDGGRQARRLLGGVDRIVLLEDGLQHNEKRDALAWLERFSHAVHLLQAPGPRDTGEQKAHEYCVLAKPATMHPVGLWLKRALDTLLSLAALVVLLPGLLIVAALIRLESEGPALFRQPRLGCDNLPFTVFKFRTMRQNGASDGSVQAVRGDSRVTRLGAILRKTSIDELPQLLNVLNGTMSLVGPRPHPLALNCRFEPLIERYAARHSVLPGITGWAQINGARGETPTVEAMQRRVDLDLEYVRRRSTLLDVWILLRTVGSVLKARNVY